MHKQRRADAKRVFFFFSDIRIPVYSGLTDCPMSYWPCIICATRTRIRSLEFTKNVCRVNHFCRHLTISVRAYIYYMRLYLVLRIFIVRSRSGSRNIHNEYRIYDECVRAPIYRTRNTWANGSKEIVKFTYIYIYKARMFIPLHFIFYAVQISSK